MESVDAGLHVDGHGHVVVYELQMGQVYRTYREVEDTGMLSTDVYSLSNNLMFCCMKSSDIVCSLLNAISIAFSSILKRDMRKGR